MSWDLLRLSNDLQKKHINYLSNKLSTIIYTIQKYLC